MSDGNELAGRRAQRSRGRLTASGAYADSEVTRAANDRAAAAEDRRLAAADRRRAAEYLAAAYRDDLTGALNRRPGRQLIQAEIDRAERSGTPLALLFLDVDGLKRANDAHGHLRGDEILAAVGTALRGSLRSYDLIVRYGGDEFVCALPAGTPAIASSSVERARRRLQELAPGATFSVGHAQLRPGDGLDDLVHRADADLYRIRSSGRRAVSPEDEAATDGPPGRRPTIVCGACRGRIPLVTLALDPATQRELSATCPDCGEIASIQLVPPLH